MVEPQRENLLINRRKYKFGEFQALNEVKGYQINVTKKENRELQVLDIPFNEFNLLFFIPSICNEPIIIKIR